MLRIFVGHCRNLYGLEYLVYNVHALIHLSDDYVAYGSLDCISAFSFENYLGQLKRLIRTSNKPLQQVYRRLHEKHYACARDAMKVKENNVKQYQCQREHSLGPLPCGDYRRSRQFKKLICNYFLLTTHDHSHADCYCMLKDQSVIEILNILSKEDCSVAIVGRKFTTVTDLYTYPWKSSTLNVFAVSGIDHAVDMWSTKNVLCKCILFPMDHNVFAVFPLLHSA